MRITQEGAVQVLNWALESVLTLQHQIPRGSWSVALSAAENLPESLVGELAVCTTAFLVWVRGPHGVSEERSRELAARTAAMVVPLLRLTAWAPDGTTSLELALWRTEDLSPLPEQPLAGWWAELLAQAQSAVGAAA